MDRLLVLQRRFLWQGDFRGRFGPEPIAMSVQRFLARDRTRTIRHHIWQSVVVILVLSQYGFSKYLVNGPIKLSCVVESVDGWGGSDGQGQVRSAAAAGTTGRTPAFDSGGEKLRPSDRPSADSAQERRWLGSSPRWRKPWMWRWAPCIGSSSALPGKGWRGPCGTGPRPTGIGSWMTGARRTWSPPGRGRGRALACGPAPEGHDHWTLRLLAGKVVELGLASSMSHEGVRKRLKKTLSSRGRRRNGASPR